MGCLARGASRTGCSRARPTRLAADMVRAGFTGWGGAVADPLVEGLVRPHILFPAYVSGRSLAEAYALATRHVGWRTVVFGDPLCRPFGPEPDARRRSPATSGRA